MDIKDYLYTRFLIYCNYSGNHPFIMQELKPLYDDAYKKDDIRRLKALDKELNVMINGFPSEIRKEINALFTKNLGEEPDSEKQVKMMKKIAAIRKRGYIKNRDEYDLVHNRIDQLVDEVEENEAAADEMAILDDIMMNDKGDPEK